MHNTKLVTLLKSFSRQEISKFREFVSSPYFNKNKNVVSLCEAVTSHYPEFSPAEFTEANIYNKTFGKENPDYFKLRNVMSDLFSLAVDFLKISGIEKKDIDLEILLLNILHERKLDTLYLQREKKVNKTIEALASKDEDIYLNEYQLERINTAHHKFDGSSYTFNQIQTEFDSFLNYSLTGMLRMYSKMLHNRNHGNINFNMEMFEHIWGYVKDRVIESNPSYMIYRQIIMMELSKSEEDFKKLVSLKEKYLEILPDEEHYYVLLVQNSFSAYMLKLGDESYYYERFKAFRDMFENRFMDPHYVIFPNFISAFTSACMAEEYEWAEAFLKSAQNGISPPDEKLNAVTYCKAFMAYRKKDFDNALKLFSKTNFKLYLMKVMVRSYSVRIYYEQDLFEQTINAIDSFRHYLKTEKLMDDKQKGSHYEFLRLLNKLAEFKLEGINKKNKADLKLLIKQIEKMTSNPLGTKNWLLQKADELNT